VAGVLDNRNFAAFARHAADANAVHRFPRRPDDIQQMFRPSFDIRRSKLAGRLPAESRAIASFGDRHFPGLV
jgi:hypothetical protein